MFLNILLSIVIVTSQFNFDCVLGDNRTLIKKQRQKSVVPLIYTVTPYSSSKNLSCEWLSRLKHHRKMCWNKKGLAEVLLKAKNLSIIHCENKFRFEPWNCSSRAFFLKNVYRETAFMYSLASSALVFSIARACSEGRLAGCKCGDHGKEPHTDKWQWGGCGDNVKYGRRFTKKILQLRKMNDKPNSIQKYNMETGIRIVSQNEETVCRCHGVSGSCSIKICFKKIRPFNMISEQLKSLYHTALKVQANTNMNKTMFKNKKTDRRLLYLEESPNFCNTTVGRLCKDTDNCATLCCARGFDEDVVQVVEKCNCRWHTKEIFQVQCEQCYKNETAYRCE